MLYYYIVFYTALSYIPLYYVANTLPLLRSNALHYATTHDYLINFSI